MGTKTAVKARRHIYGSGAAGMSNKGVDKPTDKRNEDKPCPYCDRTFKQLDRLRQHIEKKHAEEQREAVAAAETSTTTAVAGSGSYSNSSGTSEQDQQGKKSNAASAQAGIGGGNTSHQGASAGSNATTGGNSSNSSSSDKPKYIQKTPKMLLMELCQKTKKFQKPKYYPDRKARSGGGYLCKVFLPGRNDRDSFSVWSREKAKTPEDAAQHAAVAALHRVAGDRQYNRILPEDYRGVWEAHVDDARLEEERRAKRERAKEEDERRRKRKARDGMRTWTTLTQAFSSYSLSLVHRKKDSLE